MTARTVIALAVVLILAGCGGDSGGGTGDADEVAALQDQLEEAERAMEEQAEEMGALNEQLAEQEAATEDSATDEPTEPPSDEQPSADATAEATEETEAPADGSAGSRENPLPVGQSARVGDWEVLVVGTTPNATEQVLTENQFNDPPAEGRQFFIVNLEATYVGEESGTFWVDVSASTVDDANVTYETFEDGCGSIPDSIDDSGEAFLGGTVTGNLCWSVSSEQVGSLVMFVEPSFSFNGERVWFALS